VCQNDAMTSGTRARPPAGADQHSGGTEAADRVADVLLLFARSDEPLGVSVIARDLGLSKAVVHRILQSLLSRSLVQPVPGRSSYQLGPSAIGLGTRAWSQLDVRTVAAPILKDLRDRTRETTTLSILVGRHRIYLDQFESPQEIKMAIEIGPRFALHSGASSRAILAHLPPAFAEEASRELARTQEGFDEPAFLRELEETRRRGWTASHNERGTGGASIAAAFFDGVGNVLGSISVSGPVFRYPGDHEAEHATLVVEAAEAITEALRDAS
jgi:DNA-binding IclR family transcriptional regulator